jgi:hypothetical protein
MHFTQHSARYKWSKKTIWHFMASETQAYVQPHTVWHNEQHIGRSNENGQPESGCPFSLLLDYRQTHLKRTSSL